MRFKGTILLHVSGMHLGLDRYKIANSKVPYGCIAVAPGT